MIALEQQGLRVPRDVSLVAFDDVQWMSMVEPPITTVRQPVADMARSAAELALRRLREDSTGPSEHRRLPDRAHRAGFGGPAREGDSREGRVGEVTVAIGLDVGTTGARAVAVDEHGDLRGRADVRLPAAHPSAAVDGAGPRRVVARDTRGPRRRSRRTVAEAGHARRRDRAHGADARLGVPRCRRRGDPSGAAVERSAHR